MHPDYVEETNKSFISDSIDIFLYVAIFSSIVMIVLAIAFLVFS